jgi:prepilin-type processing-associated H-X9-DG protein
LLAVFAWAQPLADRIPADAVVYVGWRGSQDLGAPYENSHLKAILDASDLPKVFSEFLPQLAQKIGERQPDVQEIMALVSTIGSSVGRHPCAFYFGGLDMSNPDMPMPRIAVLCDAGKDAAALQEQLNKAIAKAEGAPIPLAVKVNGPMVALTMGKTPAIDRMMTGKDEAGQPLPWGFPQSLAGRKEFADALKQVHKESVAIVYGDVQAALAIIDNVVSAGRDEQAKVMWPKVRDALGLGGLKSFIWTGAFQGKDWTTAAFLGCPAPRPGILSALGGNPMTDQTYKLIPKSATIAAVGDFDAANLVAQIREALGNIDPRIQTQFDAAVQQVQQMTGLDLLTDLLEPLPKTWAFYIDPNTGGSSLLGSVIVGTLRDAEKAQQSLSKLEEVVNALIGQQMRNQKIVIKMNQTKVGEMTIHYLGVPLVAPSWAIKDGNLYLGLYPQVVCAAADHVAGKAKSILENEDFLTVRKRLGAPAGAAISFTDVPRMLPEGYAMWMCLTRYAGFADMFVGVQSPAMLLPPLHRITPHVAPAGTASWVDEAGLHMKSCSSFPGSELLAGDPGSIGVGGSALMISILLPSLNRAREMANRAKCASNLRQIGQGMLLYANENRGRYPDELGQLNMGVVVFVCPSRGTSIPPDIRGPTPEAKQQAAKWVDAHSDYVYLGKGLTYAIDAQTVLVYEKESNHSRDGMNMLYGDGHVEWMPMPAARQLIAKQAK